MLGLSSSLFLLFGLATFAATPAERRALLGMRLPGVPLSARALASVTDVARRRPPTVREVVTCDPTRRREWFGTDPVVRSELRTWLAPRGLRLDLSAEELRAFESEGRSTALGSRSLLRAAGLTPRVLSYALDAGCATLGEVRERRLNDLLYNLDENAHVREIRAELHGLPLAPGETVVTRAEFAFAEALRESRIGLEARRELRARHVRTLDDLARLPFTKMAAEGTVAAKRVRQMKALLPRACAALIDEGDGE